MASELKPCPFCGGTDVNLHHSAKAFMSWISCKSCGLDAPSETGVTDEEAITYWNTRPAPAATDTGLVRYDLSMFGNGIVEMGGGAYVRADQAEKLLAAERAKAAEKERLRFEGDLDKWMKIIGAGITGYQPEAYTLMDFSCEDLVKLRADNAAQAARINGFEGFLDDLAEILGCERDIGDVVNEIDAINNRAEVLEAKLAAAEKALEPFAEAAEMALISGNPPGNHVDAICFLEARAVWRGKPS